MSVLDWKRHRHLCRMHPDSPLVCTETGPFLNQMRITSLQLPCRSTGRLKSKQQKDWKRPNETSKDKQQDFKLIDKGLKSAQNNKHVFHKEGFVGTPNHSWNWKARSNHLSNSSFCWWGAASGGWRAQNGQSLGDKFCRTPESWQTQIQNWISLLVYRDSCNPPPPNGNGPSSSLLQKPRNKIFYNNNRERGNRVLVIVL